MQQQISILFTVRWVKIQKQIKEIQCCVCSKKLKEKEGMVSSTGITVCGKECQAIFLKQKTPALTVYSRVTGYCTPVSSWNAGKKREFEDRHKYSRLEA